MMKGLELCERFYFDVVRETVEELVSPASYSAGLTGWGSEVLGYDDEFSRDHNWGPRLQIFLSPAISENNSDPLNNRLSASLPGEFLGYSTHFGPSVNGDQLAMSPAGSGPIRHMIEIWNIPDYCRKFLELEDPASIKPIEWLSLDEHKLLGVTVGKVFHDGHGGLEALRSALRFYPSDVRLFLLARQWK